MKKFNRSFAGIILPVLLTVLMITGVTIPEYSFGATTQVVSMADFDDTKVPELLGKSAVLMDAGSGEVIYQKNADVIREPASVTKILNFLVVLDHLDMDQVVTAPYEIESSGTIIDLRPQEKMTVEQLCYGMMLESGNDAAQVLGETVANGDPKTFSKMMNAKARECGAENTDFKSPNGLNEDASQLNYTTAMDLAKITKVAMQNKQFRKVVGTTKYVIPKTNKHDKRVLLNSNKCLWADTATVEINGSQIPIKYTGATGVKTGTTTSAGCCYVGTAKRGDSEFIAVILDAPTSDARFQDAIKLWDYGFEHYDTYVAERASKFKYELEVKRGNLAAVDLELASDLAVTVNEGFDGKGKITTEVQLDDEHPVAPVKKGTVMGVVVAKNDKGSVVGQTLLYAGQNVKKGGPLSYVGIADEELPRFYAISGSILAAIILILIIILRIKYKKNHPGRGRKSRKGGRGSRGGRSGAAAVRRGEDRRSGKKAKGKKGKGSRGQAPRGGQPRGEDPRRTQGYAQPSRSMNYEADERAPWSSMVMEKNAQWRDQRRPPLGSDRERGEWIETPEPVDRSVGKRSGKEASDRASRRVRNKRRKRRVMKRNSDK